jgi:hypothetical protein
LQTTPAAIIIRKADFQAMRIYAEHGCDSA